MSNVEWARGAVLAFEQVVQAGVGLRVRDGQRETVAQKDLQPGDVIEVAAGGRLPADGKLITPSAP